MKIDHIALFCKDLEQMRQFFLDYFEGTSNEQYHNPKSEIISWSLLALANQLLPQLARLL
jgi:lactoylglutathione lyase